MRTVRTPYTALMVLLAKATDRELAWMVSYLKEENRILRARLPEQINTTPRERERLLGFGRNLSHAVGRTPEALLLQGGVDNSYRKID